MKRVIHLISNIGGAASAILLGILMFQQTADVAGRYLFNSPIPGTLERGALMMAMVTALCWGYTQMTKSHVRMDLLVGRLQSRTRALLGLLTTALTLIFFCILVWRAAASGIAMCDSGRLLPGLNWPLAPFQFIIAACGISLCLEFIVDLIESFEKATGRK